MVIEVHDVFVAQSSVQLDLPVNLQRRALDQRSDMQAKVTRLCDAGARPRSPSRAGAAWRRARAG